MSHELGWLAPFALSGPVAQKGGHCPLSLPVSSWAAMGILFTQTQSRSRRLGFRLSNLVTMVKWLNCCTHSSPNNSSTETDARQMPSILSPSNYTMNTMALTVESSPSIPPSKPAPDCRLLFPPSNSNIGNSDVSCFLRTRLIKWVNYRGSAKWWWWWWFVQLSSKPKQKVWLALPVCRNPSLSYTFLALLQ